MGAGLKDGTAVVVVDEAVVVWAEEEHAPVGDDVGDEKGAGISDECHNKCVRLKDDSLVESFNF